MDRFRDVDRRVAHRAWTPVRRPSLPAWAWLTIDVAIGSLVVTGIGEVIRPASETGGQAVQTIGFLVVIGLAIVNFLRTTRRTASQNTRSE